MTRKADELIRKWREMGPISWSESSFGWIGEDGQPVKLTPWQRAALEAWWDNRETCSTFAVSNVKKTGKTFLDAVLLCWRWLVLPGQHFAAGNDLDQAAARSFSEISAMVKRNPYLSQACRVLGKELTFEPTGSVLTALSTDAAGNAGANHLTASHTEAWGIIYEAGIRAFEELTPPPGRKHGSLALRICDSYAGFIDESKTWHDLVDRGLKGKRISKEWPIYKAGGLVLFHMEGEEAQERCFRGTPKEAAAYYEEQQATLRPNAFTRMHGNQRTSGEAGFVTPEQWQACYDSSARPLQANDTRRMILGVDAATSNDFCGLVGVIYDNNTQLAEVIHTRVWAPKKLAGIRFGKPTIDLQATVGEEVMKLHKAGQVGALVADPYQLHTLILDWERAGIRVIELAQNAGRVEADQALYTAIVGRTIRHYGDPDLNAHIGHAVATETVRGFRLAKEKASRKIDLAVALSMAHWGALNQQKNRGEYREFSEDEFWGDTEDLGPNYAYHPEMGVEAWNQPHPPGVYARNCPHRAKGCIACYTEFEASGENERLRAIEAIAAANPLSDEGLAKHFVETLGLRYEYQERNKANDSELQTLQRFHRSVKNRIALARKA